MAGRPSKYTKDLASRLCAQLAMGKSLRTVCKAKDMPSAVTVFAWMGKYPEFLKQYEEAKRESADAMLEEMFDIADEEEDVQRARLKIDVRKWAASKLKPQKYGEKITQEHTGEIVVTKIKLTGVSSGS